ncbi:MAG: hypothetical protein CK530_02870 [Planctomycetaceae bacterium]|nr:MAG: hypothetical protein CK530_02870 [Planctomycetaceae bacterium]
MTLPAHYRERFHRERIITVDRKNRIRVAAIGGVAAVVFSVTIGSAKLPAADDHFGLPQVKFINEQVAAGWTGSSVQPSAAATDGEWCRRVHLDIIGRVPSVVELQNFVAESSPAKRPELVSRLLGDDYEDEYARNWTDVWTTILIGRDVANQMVSRPGMRQYLRRAFSKNIPYDQFMEELVTATGLNTNSKGVEGFNGATNFLSGKMEENGAQATAKTAQVFLGLQVQCTQCHNHPFNKGKQNQFWEFNAFFRQSRALRKSEGDQRWVEMVDEDFAGEGGNPEEAELYYELRNGLMKVAYPVFIDGTEISKNGYLPGSLDDGTKYGVNRRQEISQLIKASPLLSKAIVNRMWGHFLGYGFTKPVDDLGEHNPPSHPELLDGLADQFREQSYDLKELVRWIVLSKPYSLSSKATKGNVRDDPALGEKPKFSHFYLRQMQAEQLYESLLTATEADKSQGEAAAKKKDDWLKQFVIAFGTDEGDDSTTFNGSIPQVLMMFNGDLVKNATGTGKGGFLDKIASGSLRNPAKIDMLYMAAFARKPSPKELDVANQLMVARKGDAVGALQDVWWAVLNSNEFIINH